MCSGTRQLRYLGQGGRVLSFRPMEANETLSRAARRLGIVSILETVSFLVLIFMMISGNEGGVSVVGMTHGLLFLAYALLVVSDRHTFGWTWGFVAVAVLTGPIGAILVLERLRTVRSPG